MSLLILYMIFVFDFSVLACLTSFPVLKVAPLLYWINVSGLAVHLYQQLGDNPLYIPLGGNERDTFPLKSNENRRIALLTKGELIIM